MAERAAEVAAAQKYGGCDMAGEIQESSFLQTADFHSFRILIFIIFIFIVFIFMVYFSWYTKIKALVVSALEIQYTIL